MTAGLSFARALIDQGVAVFLARPVPDGWTGKHANGYILPTNWQRAKPHAAALDLYRPGMAVCAVGGGPLSVLDVDPRNGGHDAMLDAMTAGLWPRVYAITTTPGGGTHHYVANLGIPKTKRDGIDYQGGLGEESAGFVFLPPTVRTESSGKCAGAYTVKLDALDAFGMDDPSGTRMREWLLEPKQSTQNVASGDTFDLGGQADPALEIGHKIPSGDHQDVLFRYACSLRARGVREAEAEGLVNLRGAQDCVPPWKGPDSAWSAVRHAYKYEEGAPRPTTAAAGDLASPAHGSRKLVVQSAADIEMQVSDWLWRHDLGPDLPRGQRYEHWIPLGGLTLLGGREGTGKSSWTARLCAQVTNGKMEGIYAGKPKGVLLAATEDDWGTTIVPRLAAAGADLRRVYRVDVQISDDVTTGLTLPADVAAVRRVVAERDVALIVLDPLMSTVDGRLDTHKDADVRRALEPITRLASETDATILGLIHQNKGVGGDFLTKLMGSRAFSAVARAVLGCVETESPGIPEGEFDIMKGVRTTRQFIFGQEKNNLGRKVETGIRYELEDAMAGMSRDGREVWTSKVRVVDYRDDMTVSAAEGAKENTTGGKDGGDAGWCRDWLRSHLAAADERTALGVLVKAELLRTFAEQHGNRTPSDTTVRRAREAIGVVIEGAYWKLLGSECAA